MLGKRGYIMHYLYSKKIHYHADLIPTKASRYITIFMLSTTTG